MGLEVVYADLFDTVREHPTCSVAHCISADAKMNAGIAPLIVHDYMLSRREVAEQDPRVGETVKTPMKSGDKGRFVLHMVTKPLYYRKPTHATLTSAVESLRTVCIRDHIRDVMMPRVACGLDGMAWNEVHGILCDVFANEARVNVTVCLLKSDDP